jgi:hypothetical protein
MKQVVLEFHPASEKPKRRELLLLDTEVYEYLVGGVFIGQSYRSTDLAKPVKHRQVKAWAYLPKAEECVNR